MVETFEAQHLTKATEVLEHVERGEDEKTIYTSKLYKVPERQEPFFNNPTGGDLYNILINGTHGKFYKVNADVGEIAQLLVSQGVVKDRLIAENIAAFILSLSEKTGVDPSLMVSNLISHLEQTSQAQKEKIDPGIWGSLVRGVTNDEAKSFVKNGKASFQVGEFKVGIRVDVHGNPYFMLNGEVIKGDGLVVGIKDGEYKIVALNNIDKNHDIYKYYKELSEQGYDVYYLYVGDIRKGKNVYTGLRIEHLDVNYRGSANYYGVSKIETTFVRNGEDVRVLQIRTLNVDGHYQQQYRLIDLQDVARASSADFRWGDEKTTMWMKFSEKSIEKRTSLGYEDEFGRTFAQLFYKDENGLYHLDPTLTHVQFYNYDGTLKKEFYNVKPENRVSFLLNPTILPIAKPVEKKVPIQYYNTTIQGPDYSLPGKEVSYSLSTDAKDSTGYYSFALVDRADGRWMAVPGREFTYNGKTYHLTSQYLGEYIHTHDKDFVRVYLDEKGNVVDERTPNYIDILYFGTTPNSLYLFASQTPQTFSTSSNVTYRVDGTTTVYGVAISQERSLSKTLSSTTTEIIESQIKTQILFPAKVNETIEMPSVTLSYESKGKTLNPENASVDYLPVFVSESGTQYLIGQGLNKFGNYEVGENVFALAKFSDGAWWIKVKDGKLVDAYTSKEGTWVKLDELPQEAWQKAQITEENGSLVIKASPIKIPYPPEIANSIKEVRAYMEGTITVAGQEDAFSSYVSRELMPVEIPKPEVKPAPKPSPKEEKAPPQEKEEVKPETKVKPEVKRAQTTITVPDTIVLGTKEPYRASVKTDIPTKEKALFALEDLGNNRYNLLITNPQEATLKIGGQEFKISKDVKRLGYVENGTLYIRVKDGKVIDASLPEGDLLKVKLGDTPQEWYSTLERLGLNFLFSNQTGEFTVLPVLGKRVLWYGFGVDKEVKSTVAKDESLYARPEVEGRSHRYEFGNDLFKIRPNTITFRVEKENKPLSVDQVSATVIVKVSSGTGLNWIVNKDGKVVGVELPGKGYSYFDRPLPLNNGMLLELAQTIQANPDHLKWLSKEEFVKGGYQPPKVSLEYNDDKTEVTLKVEVPAEVRARRSTTVTFDYDIEYELDNKNAELSYVVRDIYVPITFVKPAEKITPPLRKRREEISTNVEFDFGSFDVREANTRTSFWFRHVNGEVDEVAWSLLGEGMEFYPLLKFLHDNKSTLPPNIYKSLSEQLENAVNTFLSVPLRESIPIDPNEKNVIPNVLAGRPGATRPSSYTLGGTLGDLINEVDPITALSWINSNSAEVLFSGNAPENVKKFIILAVIFNTSLNNVKYMNRQFDDFKAKLEAFASFLISFKDYIKDPSNPAKIDMFYDAIETLKDSPYFTGGGSDIGSTPLVKVLFQFTLENLEGGTLAASFQSTQIDLMQFNIDWTVWEHLTEEERSRIILNWYTNVFLRKKTGTEYKVVTEDGNLVLQKEETSATGFGANVDLRVGYGHSDKLQNIRVELGVGGTVYVIEHQDNKGWKVPKHILEEISVNGGAIYTRTIVESGNFRVSAFTKVEGRYTKDLVEDEELLVFTGSVGVVLGSVKKEDGTYDWKVKGVYRIEGGSAKPLEGSWDITASVRVGPNGQLSIEFQGNPDHIAEAIGLTYEHRLSEGTALSLGGYMNLVTGDKGVRLGLNINF